MASPDDSSGTLVSASNREVVIPAEGAALPGSVALPEAAVGIVAFAHGSGSSRLSPRNAHVAAVLNDGGIATLLFDLLTEEEALDRRNVFDVPLLASRLQAATEWLEVDSAVCHLPIGYFGASTGAAAALWAAAGDDTVRAIVSRGGRPDLAMSRLHEVSAPTLLIVGGLDEVVLELNRQAYAALACERELRVVPGATHLFAEPGTLGVAAAHAREWFLRHLPG